MVKLFEITFFKTFIILRVDDNIWLLQKLTCIEKKKTIIFYNSFNRLNNHCKFIF